MFWASVRDGLAVLLHWETYVLGLAFLVIAFIPYYPMMLRKKDLPFTKAGCFAILGQPLFLSLGVAVYIMSLFPIIIGTGSDAAWSLPWRTIIHAPLYVLLMVVVMVVLSLVASLVPILGSITSFLSLITGGTVIIFMVGMMHAVDPTLDMDQVQVVPGFFAIVGIVIISAICAWIGIIVAALLTSLIDLGKEGLGSALMLPLGAIFGFIPVFIYGAWIGNQLPS